MQNMQNNMQNNMYAICKIIYKICTICMLCYMQNMQNNMQNNMQIICKICNNMQNMHCGQYAKYAK